MTVTGMTIEEIYASREASGLRDAFEAYGDKEFRNAAILAKKARDVIDRARMPQLYILADFLYHHSNAYDVWDGTYDYAKICKELRESIAIIQNAQGKALFLAEDLPYLEALSWLSEVVIWGTRYENCMITSDTERMRTVSESMAADARKGRLCVEKISGYQIKQFASYLHHQLRIRERSQEAIGKFAHLMTLWAQRESGVSEFLAQYDESYRFIVETLEYLTSIDDFELASELRAHRFFLEKIHKMIVDECIPKGFIRLRNVEVDMFVGILIQQPYAETLYRNIIKYHDMKYNDGKEKSGRKFTEGDPVYRYFAQHNIELKCCEEDEPDDLLAESYESDANQHRMDYIIFNLNDVTIKLHEETYRAKFCVKLYRYGVCNLSLKIADNLEDCSPSKLMLIRALNGPHMGQISVTWNRDSSQAGGEKEYLYIAKEDPDNSYNTMFTEVADILHAIFKRYCHGDFSWTYNPELAWFSTTYIRRVCLRKMEGGKTIDEIVEDGSRLVEMREFKPLLLDSREARATIDDWVDVNAPSVEQTGRLAQIRSHSNDLLLFGENHATVFFPEDPEFVIFQYQQSIELIANLRTVAYNYNSIMNSKLAENKTAVSDIIEQLRTGSQQGMDQALGRMRDLLINIMVLRNEKEYICNLIESPTVSQYRDHGRLVHAMIHSTDIPYLLEVIEHKMSSIKETEESLDELIDSIETKETARLNKYISIGLGTIGIIALFEAVIEAMTLLVDHQSDYWAMPQFARFGLTILIMIIAFALAISIYAIVERKPKNVRWSEWFMKSPDVSDRKKKRRRD